MKKIIILCALMCHFAYAQKPVFTTAKVKAATVYFNAAEISQDVVATLPTGTSEIVVKNVADYLNESTVQVGAPSTLTVLSVQFTRDYISEYEPDETSPQIKRVRDSIALLENEIRKTAIAKQAETKALEVLDRNNQLAGQQNGLNIPDLMKFIEYYRVKRTEIAIAENALTEKQNKLNERLNELRSRLQTNISKDEKMSSGKLVLQVMNEAAGNVPFTINYLTQNASWTPFYDLRAENTTDPINMMYKAQVIQQTGIDWKKVKLTLSSGVPNQNNQAPLLQAWFLRYGNNPLYNNSNAFINSLQGQVPGLNITQGNGQPGADMSVAIRGNSSLSEVTVEGYRAKSSVTNYTTLNENQLSVSFDIDIPYDILSNGKKHSVTLKEIKLPAEYKHYAVPKLEKEAFLLAELSDYSKYNLLRGEANIIFEGMYIGKTFIDPNQTNDTMRMSMGRDKKIAIKREKIVDKSGTKFLSSSKEQVFTYEITIKNNKKDAVSLTLKDQYPVSTDKDIEIELLQSDKAKINEEAGILTWEVDLKAGESKKIRLSYKVKYPKNKFIENL